MSTRKHVIVLTVGSTAGTVNGRPSAMDRPAEIKEGRTYIPLRFVAENLGAGVEWDENTGTVKITF